MFDGVTDCTVDDDDDDDVQICVIIEWQKCIRFISN